MAKKRINTTRYYYRVRDEYDGEIINVHNRGRDYQLSLVGGELLSIYFVENHSVPWYLVDRVRVDTRDLYWSFGVRFSHSVHYL